MIVSLHPPIHDRVLSARVFATFRLPKLENSDSVVALFSAIDEHRTCRDHGEACAMCSKYGSSRVALNGRHPNPLVLFVQLPTKRATNSWRH